MIANGPAEFAPVPGPGACAGWAPWRRRGLGLVTGLLALCLAAAAEARQAAAIVLDYATGEVLHAEDPDAPAFPASLTKMMTLYMVFEAMREGRLTPDTRLKISSRAAAMPPTKLGLKAGSSIRVEDAIMAMVTKSANDIASAVGENLGGSEERFAELMTTRARSMGMRRTTFRNASGLPNAAQKTTARDLSILATRLITDFPQHYRFFGRKSHVFAGRTLGNHNRMLRTYDGMDGIKTGYTNASGFNLAGSARRNGHRLVAVVLGGGSASSRDGKMAKLLDRAFKQLDKRRSAPGEALVASQTQPGIAEVAQRPVWLPLERPEIAPEADVVAAATEAVVETDGIDVAAAGSIEPAEAALAMVAAAKGAPEVAPAAAAPIAVTAPRPPVAKAARPAVKSAARPTGTFGVQVGVYSTASDANRAAQLALKRAPAHLRGTFVSVHTLKQSRKVLFRAQLLGVGRNDANGACRLLKKARQDCLVIQLDKRSTAAS
jgi:D-alanyl-D-alanine carboxypeptidase